MPSPPITNQRYFFYDHHQWLLKHVRPRLNNRMDAEDTAAETFLQILASRIDPETITHPRAYLSTIAQRLIFKVYRRQQLEAAYREKLAGLAYECAPSPEETALLMDALLSLEVVLGALPGKVKKAFLLSQLDGFSYEEIGRRLGVSERTVGRYMTQALRQCVMTDLFP